MKFFTKLEDRAAEQISGGRNGENVEGQEFGQIVSQTAQIYYSPSPSFERSGRMRPGYEQQFNPSSFL